MREKSIIIQCKRTMEELRTFIWRSGRPEAQLGYNDDLVMSFATALYVRDTALRLQQQGMDLARAQLSSFANSNARNKVIMSSVANRQENPYLYKTQHGEEDISWLLK